MGATLRIEVGVQQILRGQAKTTGRSVYASASCDERIC